MGNFTVFIIVLTYIQSVLIKQWACSSVVECYVDIVEVASSILAVPTKVFLIGIHYINISF